MPKLDITQPLEFSVELRSSAEGITDTLAWGVELATRELHGIQVQATPRGVTSITAASWQHSTTVRTNEVIGSVFNQQASAWVLEQGSRAGPWRTMPPWSNESAGIGLWAKRRFGGKRARSIAYLIARKILQRGFTDKHRDFSTNAFDGAVPRLIQILDAAIDRIANDLQE
jgi:hypothetical protein